MIISNIIAVKGSAYLIEKYSYRMMGLSFAIATFIVMYVTPIFVKERVKVTKEHKGLGIFNAVIITLKNKQFLIYVMALFLFWLGWYVIANGFPYIVKIVLNRSEGDVGNFLAIVIISSLIYLPLIRILAPKLGKKFMFSTAMFVAALVFAIVFFVGIIPLSTLLIYTVLALMGFPFSCILHCNKLLLPI